MKKRSASVLPMIFVLLIAGCGNSNSAESPAETNVQAAENTRQTDTEENSHMAEKCGHTENEIDNILPVLSVHIKLSII